MVLLPGLDLIAWQPLVNFLALLGFKVVDANKASFYLAFKEVVVES
jgi:hypothetical protein